MSSKAANMLATWARRGGREEGRDKKGALGFWERRGTCLTPQYNTGWLTLGLFAGADATADASDRRRLKPLCA